MKNHVKIFCNGDEIENLSIDVITCIRKIGLNFAIQYLSKFYKEMIVDIGYAVESGRIWKVVFSAKGREIFRWISALSLLNFKDAFQEFKNGNYKKVS